MTYNVFSATLNLAESTMQSKSKKYIYFSRILGTPPSPLWMRHWNDLQSIGKPGKPGKPGKLTGRIQLLNTP